MRHRKKPRERFCFHRRIPTAAALLFVLGQTGGALDAFASGERVESADQLCDPRTDPCVIRQVIETVDGAVLDFGMRTVRIGDGGRIVSGSGDLAVVCGRFEADTAGVAIELRGDDPSGVRGGGHVDLRVRRSCSGGSSVPCLNDTDCAARGAGVCSVGSGDVRLGGRVLGSSTAPGHLLIHAAGDVDILADVTIEGSTKQSDGGSITVTAAGDIRVHSRIQLRSGGSGTGGDVHLAAGGDLRVIESIDVRGGDFDGGIIDLAAAGSIFVEQDLRADSSAGSGFGGTVALRADGDLIVSGGGPANRLLVATDGHTSAENAGGDGGPQSLFAGGRIQIGEFVRLSSRGAAPDGTGDRIEIAGAEISVRGEIFTSGEGGESPGGSVLATATQSLNFNQTSRIDSSGARGGGDIDVSAGGTLVHDGRISAAGRGASPAGAISLVADAAVRVGGEILVDGRSDGLTGVVLLSGCDVYIGPQAVIDNKPDGAVNRVHVRDYFQSAPGALIRTGDGGENVVVFGDASRPPELGGKHLPSVRTILDPELSSCVTCSATSTRDQRSCDDGIACTVDRCTEGGCEHLGVDALCESSRACFRAVCEPMTGCREVPAPGAPCSSDGNVCTDDVCDGSGVCQHRPNELPCGAEGLCGAEGVCTAGLCTPDERDGFVSAQLKIARREPSIDSRFTVKASFLRADPVLDLTTQGVTVEVGDAAGPVFHSSFVPAGGFTRRRVRIGSSPAARMESADSGRPIVYVFRDADGEIASGLRRAIVRLHPGGAMATAKFFIRTIGLESAVDLRAATLALQLAAHPPDGTCLSARRLACAGGVRRLRCLL